MRQDLIDRFALVCPVCRCSSEEPAPLELNADRAVEGDVVSGSFSCPDCSRRYPVLDGVAVLDPEPLRSTYDRPDFLQAYLWTHYADLSPDLVAEAGLPGGDYFARLGGDAGSGVVLDLGCNVGRLTFDLAKTADHVLGIERSFEAVKRAREIARTGRVAFHLKDEGDRGRYVDLDASSIVRPNVEFVCGDAAALPLPPACADTIVAANLLDRLPRPEVFLERADRALRPGGRLILSLPFTWREAGTDRDRWIGNAEHSGREALLMWFEDHDYEVEEVDDLGLLIRNHCRAFEWIRPLMIRGKKASQP